MLLSALAGEHLLILGPPGTAKSALVSQFSQLISARYFEYLARLIGAAGDAVPTDAVPAVPPLPNPSPTRGEGLSRSPHRHPVDSGFPPLPPWERGRG